MINDDIRSQFSRVTVAKFLTLVSYAAIGTAAAGAQVVPSAKAPPSGVTDGLSNQSTEEIVVTAQKRSTLIQDTPIAMSAYRAEDVIRAGVSDVAGLTRLAPDLQMTQKNSYLQLSIRGVTSLDVSATGDPALTVDIDGEFINRGIAVNASLFDLERVEILRGPQGTLYGRNATAGAINLISAKPELTSLGGFVTAGYGNYDAKPIEAAINLPVSESLAVRVAGFHNDHDGYRNNGAAGRGDDANTSAVRISALYKPSDHFSAYLAGEYVNIDQAGVAQYGVNVTSATPGLIPYTNPDDPTQSSLIPSKSTFAQNPSTFPVDNIGFYKSQQYAVRGRLDYDFDVATLSYIAAYRHIGSSQFQNSDGLAPGGGTHYYVDTPKQDSGTQSHELRLSGAASSPVIWQAGLFFFRESQNLIQSVFSPNFVAGPFPANPAYVFTNYRPDLKTTSKAAFGQITVPLIADRLSVTGGLRYTHDQKSSTFINCPLDFAAYASGSGDVPAVRDTCPGRTSIRQNASSSKLTWSAGIDFHPAVNHLIYGKVSSGYKAGGFDTIGSFGPESLIAYELGSKNEFFGRRLTFNAAAFYYDYKNQQVQVLLNLQGGFITQNAGASRIYGLETETTYRVTDDNRITLSANYLNAKFTDYLGQYGTLSKALYPANLSGNRPPLAPKFVAAFGYSHTFHVDDRNTITASGSSRYTSKYFLSVNNWSGSKVSGYIKSDLGLEYNSSAINLTVRFYVHNLENKIVNSYAEYIANPGEYVFEYSEPRTYGIQLTKRF
jgi:iron complex outermembrane receptor protein